MKLSALLKVIETLEVGGSTDVEISEVVSDSRRARPGSLFVAIPGLRQDGWDYADDALARGAVAVVAERKLRGTKAACAVRVGDARLAVALLAGAIHGHPADRLCMVGITGTNGKTTTAYMMRDVLRAGGREPALLGTVEYRIGARVIPAVQTTPDAPVLHAMLAQSLSAGCTSAVMEVSSHALDQRRTAGIEFDAAVFTNLTRDHLDYHRDMDCYFRAKAALFESLAQGRKRGTAIVNRDDPHGAKLLDRIDAGVARVSYGMDGAADVVADEIRLSPEGSIFHVQTPWGSHRVDLRLLGRFNIANALATIATAGALGLDLDATVDALSGITLVPGRLEPVPTGKGVHVFVDYAHTDDALLHVLTTLREIAVHRLIVVFGCGGDRDRSKRPLMGAVAAQLADCVVVTTDNPRSEIPSSIIADILGGIEERQHVEAIEDRRLAIARALETACAGDIVLIAGKGHENFQQFANKTVPFDDRQVVASLL